MSYFDPVDPKQNFPELERGIIEYWKQNDTFRKSIEQRPRENSYVFFDGPPFATGLPHYGHILAGTIKDVIPRFFTMRGKRIERRFGWDCHGVPVEFQVEKEMNIGGKPEIEKMGVEKYNELCRSIVLRCAADWERTVTRMGRWVDFRDDYKTMEPKYMESVWWVFKSLWDKGLIYEGEKVVAYSPKLGSPLSNFEAGLNYKDIDDPAVTVKFELEDDLPKGITIRSLNSEADIAKYARFVSEQLVLPTGRSELFPKDFQKNFSFYGAFDSRGNMIGSISARSNEERKIPELRNMAVEKNWQHNGIGKTLALRLFEDLQSKGYKMCCICARESALVFYDQFPGVAHTGELYMNEAGSQEWLTVDLQKTIAKKTYALAWTTTPWSLPSNLALAVHPDLEYVEVAGKDGRESYILAAGLVEKYIPELGADPRIIRKFFGRELTGKKYHPPFPFFRDHENAFQIFSADFVSAEEGTGIVHTAPTGADDAPFLQGHGVKLFYAFDENCYFDATIPELQGKYFRSDPEVAGSKENNANDWVIETLKKSGKLFRREQIRHSYPHCWRTECALMYRGVKTWFVNVEKIKKQMVEHNKKIRWVPDAVGHKRFANWLENAQDWAISRNRYWGAPLPVWKCTGCDNVECIGSIAELQEKGLKNSKIFVIRHGEAEHNVSGILNCDPSKEICLTAAGKKMIKEQAEKLRAEKIFAIYASPFPRTRETAELIAEVLDHNSGKIGLLAENIKYDERLREVDLGEYDSKNHEEFRALFRDVSERFDANPHRGETGRDVFERVAAFLRGLASDPSLLGKNILLVTHGDPVRAVRHYFTKEPPEKIFDPEISPPPGHGEISVYSFENIPEKSPGEIDLHRPYIDQVFLACQKCGGRMERIPEVLDCWFESGSMPYGQSHFPFENEEYFRRNFPADFIAEGLDQTRGWFYTLHVLATALFDSPAFDNVIVNGIVLAEDGQKMSKSKKNYPDPHEVFEKFGVDAVRFTLMNSPVVKGDDLRFSEKAVMETLKSVFLPFWNAYSFFVTYANIDGWSPSEEENGQVKVEGKKSKALPNSKLPTPSSKLDRWILSELRELIRIVTEKMEAYEIFEAVRQISSFLERLTNGYIRRSRRRFWKAGMAADKKEAFQTLYFVLIRFCQVLAPFSPFLPEYIYRNLTKEESVHLSDFPEYENLADDPELREEFDVVETIISLGLALRTTKKLKLRQPLAKAEVFLPKKFRREILAANEEVLLQELNVKELVVMDSAEKIAHKIIKPNARILGPRFGKEMQKIIEEAKTGKFTEVEGGVQVSGKLLEEGSYEVEFLSREGLDVVSQNGIVVALDMTVTEELQKEGYVRELIRLVQESRKEAGFEVDDRIFLDISGPENILAIFQSYEKEIAAEVLAKEISFGKKLEKVNLGKEMEIDGMSLEIELGLVELKKIK